MVARDAAVVPLETEESDINTDRLGREMVCSCDKIIDEKIERWGFLSCHLSPASYDLIDAPIKILNDLDRHWDSWIGLSDFCVCCANRLALSQTSIVDHDCDPFAIGDEDLLL